MPTKYVIEIKRGLQAELPTTSNYIGEPYFCEDTGKLYVWNGSEMVCINSGGGVWGTITGTLSNQTDLETALATNASAITAETTRAEGVEATLAPKSSLGTAAAYPSTAFDPNGAAASVQTTLTTAITAETTRAEAVEASLTTSVNGKQSALGFTPENAANKGVANGYASLDSTIHIPLAQLPAAVQGRCCVTQ